MRRYSFHYDTMLQSDVPLLYKSHRGQCTVTIQDSLFFQCASTDLILQGRAEHLLFSGGHPGNLISIPVRMRVIPFTCQHIDTDA